MTTLSAPGSTAPAVLPLLNQAFEIRGRVLRNRTVTTGHSIMAPWTPGMSADPYIEYCRRRARGGVGMQIVQPLIVEPFHDWPRPVFDRLRALADAIHGEGGTCVIQVVSFGGQIGSAVHLDERAMWSFDGRQDEFGEASHRMTTAEVQQMVDAHGRLAQVVMEAGLDGVELHGAHGYLLQQSHSPWGNRREDEWGEHLRFVRAVIDATRAGLGDGILGYRVCAADLLRPDEGGLSDEALRAVAAEIVDTGEVDFLDSSIGTKAPAYSQPAVASYRYPDGYELQYAAALREAIGARIPVVGLGGVTDPAMAERALAGGVCDLVGMTRAYISDPDLGLKIMRGETGLVRRCVRANECVNRRVDAKPMACWHNPEYAREGAFALLAPAVRSRRVVVVGGGPAGLQAAQVAATRGHRVTLLEARPELGGRLRLVAGTSARRLLHTVDFLAAELERLGVEVRLGEPASVAAVAALAPDEVILATGAAPDVSHHGLDGLLSVDEAIDAELTGPVLVVDRIGDNAAGLLVERLADAGVDVHYATTFERVVTNAGYTHRLDLVDLFRRSERVTVHVLRDLGGVADGVATLVDPDGVNQERIPVATVVAAVHPIPVDGLAAALREEGLAVHLVGDVVAPRGVVAGTREATRVAQGL
ncbi:NAD-binding protein [Nocardioides humi]|uniref:Dimethylglycine demethylation protein DgcA n=1 Tax=Nocardioides humi TaxID=449461 RepID=A0ABN2AHB5_9ACTN|nr:NAD-binding protein [Nocardioides humi]